VGIASPVRRTVRDVTFSTGGGLGAILLWSATFAVARSLSEQVGPLTAGAAVYVIGGLLCVLRFWWLQLSPARLWRLSRKYLCGCGALFVLYTAVIYLALGLARNREQLLEVALINYLWPAATILLSLPLLRQRATFWLPVGTALALIGMFLVLTQGARVSWTGFVERLLSNPAAYLLALVGAIAWAFYSNLTRRWSEPGGHGAVELFMLATGLTLLTLRWLVSEPAVWTTRALAEAFALGAITALSYALWDLAMRRGNLVLVASCSYLTPLLSTLVSSAYLRVAPKPQLWFGCLLLVAGSLITWRSVSASNSSRPTQGTVALPRSSAAQGQPTTGTERNPPPGTSRHSATIL